MPHLFWARLDGNGLTPAWHLSPQEGDGFSIPDTQRYCGLAVVDERLVITGSWNGGALTMGSNAQTRVTLPVPNSAGLDAGFAGVLDTDMTWLGTDLLSGMLTFLGMNEGSGSEIYDDVNEATAVFHSNEPGRMAPDWDGAPVLSYAKGDQ